MSTLNPRQPTPRGFTAYARCSRCGTERPASGLVFVGDAPPVCVDTAWCGQQAGVGLGKLDGGAP